MQWDRKAKGCQEEELLALEGEGQQNRSEIGFDSNETLVFRDDCNASQ